MDKTSLGTRMKGYEGVNQFTILPRTPTIIRVDGKAFHTLTRGFDRPYDAKLRGMMNATAMRLMVDVQNARFAYTQSDEISILLNDWGNINTSQWFGGKVQKMASISAAIATAEFGRVFRNLYPDKQDVFPLFDARVFQLPEAEVANYFIWRQQDAERNSIQMLGRAYFSHKQMNGKNVSDVQDMLMHEHNINWNDCEVWQRRGSGIITRDGTTEHIREIPIFTKKRELIEDLLK